MGNLLSSATPKEPTTVEECDSTWETDSGGEPEEEDEGDRRQAEPEEEEEDGRRQEEWETGEQEDEQRQREPSVHCSNQEDEARAAAPEEEKASGEGVEEAEAAEQSSSIAEQIIKPKRSFYAARDLYKYRHQYPQNFKDSRCQNDLWNLRFYLNKIPLKPDGVYIEEILSKWKGDYDKLEHNHTYIQWLFPLREQGLNFYAKELTAYEIEELKKNKEAVKRFLLAYKMMLEFFGIKLMNKIGNVTRAANWQERFQHLNESQHNYLRITRILKSLGELGYEGFKPPLVKLFLQEALVENTIPNIKQSALEYFVYTIKDRRERRKLLRFAQRHYKPSEHFVWGPPKTAKPEESNMGKKLVSSCAYHNPVQMQASSKDTNCTSTLVSSGDKTVDTKGLELYDQMRHASTGETDKNGSNESKTENENEDSKAEEESRTPVRKEGTSPSPPEEEKIGGSEEEIVTQGCESPVVEKQVSSHKSNEDCAHGLVTTLKMSIQTAELQLSDPDLENKDGTKS